MKTYSEFITEAPVIKPTASLDQFIDILMEEYGGWIDDSGIYWSVEEMGHLNMAAVLTRVNDPDEFENTYRAAYEKGYVRVVSDYAQSQAMSFDFSWVKHSPRTIQTASKIVDAMSVVAAAKSRKGRKTTIYFERVIANSLASRTIGEADNSKPGASNTVEAVWKKIRGQL